ncbi:Protein monoubiquitination-related protein [Mycena indigotica]|uniref:WD repeat-containing protein JIP5 n=1 Tax=Mycena indigotica TaxID=2126181 RepID=A0A8H6S612_9AGAR|nr:Protein monoubiquitination-related protein [Mycena indigotica]KAF7292875.1 Protein monoubiquitination-related protein [Mycena indigotica]
MPEIAVGAQIFDLVFHPTQSIVYSALLSGQVKAFKYGVNSHEEAFTLRPSKKSCRALTLTEDGTKLYAAGKSKAIHTIDTASGQLAETRATAHEDPINRIKHVMPWLIASGDDSGVIKLWDPRQPTEIRTHKQHFDYISDFLWLPDKHHLLATSGDGTLSVMDVRSKKSTPFAQSEDQEDELLAATTIRGGTKIVVGTQLGILSIFNRSSGYGDCVDRVPGHPSSIDALCSLPPAFIASSSSPGMENTVLTGSSDGLVRAVQVLPTKLVGVVADHGELPVERLAVGGGGTDSDTAHEEIKTANASRVGKSRNKNDEEDSDDESENLKTTPGRWWLGSAGHDEVLRLTDLENFFRDPGAVNIENVSEEGDSDADADADSDEEGVEDTQEAKSESSDSDESDTETAPRKRKRKQPKDVLEPETRRKKGRNELDVQGTFFDDL